ncbi:MAG: peptide chain release factor 3 [Armatimonadota bacterium]
MSQHREQIQRRRTFAIISHPDAGKTTLTEKLLLYGGAIQLAGSVSARKNQRKATSDWMALEQQRGISITSTVLQFEYEGHVLNLLDTPGHQDFSEDTYRTLMAADSAVMLIDNAKGVEPQTRKLFHVCRQRGIPIFTFINKMDRPGQEPLELLAEIEEVLGISSVPINWPIGDGSDFRGVYDRRSKEVHLFERTDRGAYRAPLKVTDLDDPVLAKHLGDVRYTRLREEIELLDVAGEELDQERVDAGEVTPAFFGSAVTNFGVEPFLHWFVRMAPAPRPYLAGEDAEVTPEDPHFRGFVFKIQANMDPNHRDRIAFMRVVSGRFERDMSVQNARLGRSVRLTRPQKLFAQDREIMEEAYPGDIIGLTNPGVFNIGDTLYTGTPVRFRGIPRFQPEHFAILRNTRIDKYKQFQKGIDQLGEEGVVQVFYDVDAARREPILGAVGRLQFEVVQFRLRSEYGVETVLEPLPYSHVRWLDADPAELKAMRWFHGSRRVEDVEGQPAGLFDGDWSLNYMAEQHQKVQFLNEPPERVLVGK